MSVSGGTCLTMRIDTRFVNWGLFFILAGAIPLAVREGLIGIDAVNGWWRLWPLLIVGAGVGILLRRTPGAFLGGLIAAVVFGVLVGGALAAGSAFSIGDIGCGSGTNGTPFASRSGDFGPSGGSVDLELSCGEMTATTAQGTTWTVAGTAPDGTAPVIESAADHLSLRSHRWGVALPAFTENREQWNLTLPSATSTLGATLNAGSGHVSLGGSSLASASATVNAGSLVLDLAGTRLRSISMTVNAGSASVNLPDASLTGSLTVNAGSISFCAPASVGLRLTTSDNLTGGDNFGNRGLTKSGHTWTSANWSTATNRIDLSTSANLGSFELNPEGGCR